MTTDPVIDRNAGYPDFEGCIRLMKAFWESVRTDLMAGNPKTLAWLDTPEFERWAALTTANVSHDAIRAELRGIFGKGLPYFPGMTRAPGKMSRRVGREG